MSVEIEFPDLEQAKPRATASSRGFDGRSVYMIAIYGVLILAALMAVVPFGYVVSTSFKESMSMFKYPPDWLPKNPTLENYRALVQEHPFWRWMANSFFVASTVTIIKVVIDSMAGYAFAKMRFWGREPLFLVVLLSLMIPTAAILIPLFIIIRELHMLNTYWALILPGLASPIGIFMMRQFIESLPNDLENAARLDGCSEFQIYRKIVLPLVKPGLVVLGVFTFMAQWTSYLWPLVVITRPEIATLTLGSRTLTSQFSQDYGVNGAFSVLSMLPMVLVFIFLQRYFIAGSIAGALKE